MAAKFILRWSAQKNMRRIVFILSVTDDGIGISPKKRCELEKKPHYMESTDERLDLRHGLGLLIVQQIVSAHKGTMQIVDAVPHGCKTSLTFVLLIDRSVQMRYTETMTKPIGSLLLKYGCRLESSTTTSNKRGRK